jgi:hypothetical protein
MAEQDRRIALLDDALPTLDASAAVANCAMNRERQLAGASSYARGLGSSPLDVLTARIGEAGTRARRDLCCGSGRALIQAASQLQAAALAGRATVTGVDLVDAFAPVPAPLPGLELICATAAT